MNFNKVKMDIVCHQGMSLIDTNYKYLMTNKRDKNFCKFFYKLEFDFSKY